jgi:hypothetical protein
LVYLKAFNNFTNGARIVLNPDAWKKAREENVMKAKMLSILVLSTVLLSMFAVSSVSAAKPIAVVLAKGAIQADKQLNAMVNNITWVEWRVVLDEINSTHLTGASFLLMVNIDSSQTYSDAEVAAVKTWFSAGGKTLWVSGDSDFPPNDVKRQASANKVLEAVGSRLRMESAAVEDPTSMADAPYRVLGVSASCDAPVKFLVDGVTRALFHGPGPVVGYVGGKYVSLETNTIDGVYKVMASDAEGVLKDNDPTVAPEVHKLDVTGVHTLMALDFDYAKKNMVIATGEAPIAQYQGLYKPEIMDAVRYGTKYPTQGDRLFDNLLAFSLVTKNAWCESQATIAAKTSQVATLQGQVGTLTTDKTALQTQVTGLTAEKAALTTDKTNLQGQVAKLQADLTTANSNAGTWQMAAVALLIVGLVVGVFVGPMIFKKK